MTDSILLDEAELHTGDPTASSNPDRRFLDFSLNGRSLISLFAPGGHEGRISRLWIDNPVAAAESVNAAERLLGRRPGDAPEGTVSIYVCAACGDLGCGAITARVEVADDVVAWSEWGYRTNREDDDSWEVPAIGDVRDFVFDRDDYERVMIGAIERIERPQPPVVAPPARSQAEFRHTLASLHGTRPVTDRRVENMFPREREPEHGPPAGGHPWSSRTCPRQYDRDTAHAGRRPRSPGPGGTPRRRHG